MIDPGSGTTQTGILYLMPAKESSLCQEHIFLLQDVNSPLALFAYDRATRLL